MSIKSSSSMIEALGPHFPRCLKSTFFVSNVHCSSCVAYINEILLEMPAVRDVEVTIMTHEVHVRHGVEIGASKLATALIQAAFEVQHVTTCDEMDGSVVSEIDTSSLLPRESILFSTARASYPKSPLENRKHIANCDACRKEGLGSRPFSTPDLARHLFARPDRRSLAASKRYSSLTDVEQGDSDSESLVPRAAAPAVEPVNPTPPSQVQQQQAVEEFNARVSIGGMSCA